MDSKPFLAVAFLFFLVEHVYMDCHPKLANPSTRAEFLSCAREHLPKVMMDIVLDCVPENSDLESAINDWCKHGVNNPIERCIQRTANERQAELEELERNTDRKLLIACVNNIPEPSNIDVLST